MFSLTIVIADPETNKEFIKHTLERIDQEGEILLTSLEGDYIKLILNKCELDESQNLNLNDEKEHIREAFKQRVNLFRVELLKFPNNLYAIDDEKIWKKSVKLG